MNVEKEKWNSVAGDYQNTFKLGINEYNLSVLKFFEDNSMVFPGCKVIDVGCGVGKYGTYFAELGFDVTLLDISDKMIELAKKNMSEYKTPWKAICCNFDELEIDSSELYKDYDLSISTMSPAIHDVNTVKKMTSITTGWCFAARFCEWNQPLRDKIISKIGIAEDNPFGEKLGKDCDELISIIRDSGYSPSIKVVDYNWSDERSVEQMAEYMCRRCFASNPNQEKLKERLLGIIEKFSQNGKVEDEIKSKVAWIYWKGTIND